MSQATAFHLSLHVRLAKTQNCLCICAIWSVNANPPRRPLKTLWILGYPQSALRRLCPRWAHMQTCRKCFAPITKTRLFKYIENFTTKNWKFSDKTSDIFHISAKKIDCAYSLESPRRGGSNENPQSMFLSKKKKNNVYPCKPQFYYIQVGFKGVKII